MNKLLPIAAAVLLLTAVAPSYADQTAAAPPAVDAVAVSAPTCVQPAVKGPEFNDKDSDNKQRITIKQYAVWKKSVKEYSDCMTAYWTDLQTKANGYQAVAVKLNNAYIDAVKTFNAYIDEVNKNQPKDE